MFTKFCAASYVCADPKGGGGGRGSGPPLPLLNHKALRFLSDTGPDPLKNHKATRPAFNVWAIIGPLLVVVGLSLPSPTKKSFQSWTPSDNTFGIRACYYTDYYGSPGGTFLLITYNLSLITYYLTLITYYLLLITYYLLLITYHIIYKPL